MDNGHGESRSLKTGYRLIAPPQDGISDAVAEKSLAVGAYQQLPQRGGCHFPEQGMDERRVHGGGCLTGLGWC